MEKEKDWSAWYVLVSEATRGGGEVRYGDLLPLRITHRLFNKAMAEDVAAILEIRGQRVFQATEVALCMN